MSQAAAAQYKKQDGTLSLSLSADGAASVAWTSNNGSLLPVTISVAEITNLQQTPATAAKASIKIVAKDNYTFTFISAAARDDQQAITGTLRKWIETAKAPSTAAAPTSAGSAPDGSGQSASMVMAQTASTASGPGKPEEDQYDDAALLKNAELQRSLLNASPALRQRFDQAVRERPDNISLTQFSTQFWTPRIHLLRSHAVETKQGPGKYNVLSFLKSQHVDGKTKMNMTKEQILLIFSQHPLVRKAYNDLVPPLKEGEFWSQFFSSRLIKKLKGEKITDNDPPNARLDKYLNLDEGATDDIDDTIIPHFIDLEGNEQNNSQRLGNRPDWTMQPNSHDKVPILRTLNRMSRKLIERLPPSLSIEQHAPAGIDEDTYNELVLRDLQRAAEDNRVVLKVKDQSRLFSAGQGLHTSSSASAYAKRTPSQVLSSIRLDLKSIVAGSRSIGLNLESVIGIHDESSSDEELTTHKKTRVGSASARVVATTYITRAIKKRHLHSDDYLSSNGAASNEQAAKLGLSQSVFDNMCMTHNTSVEFLHYFWAVFLSGDADRANEVGRLVETLEKSLDRIKAVADNAEDERVAKADGLRKENENYTRRTGRKRKFDPNSVTGGAKVVNEIVAPLVRAIKSATDHYRNALNEQLGQSSTFRD